LDAHATSVPRWVGAHAEQVLGARDDPARLIAVFEDSLVPMVMVDDERRYLEANPPAQSTFGLSLTELRGLRIDDLTPPYLSHLMETGWARLLATGAVMGHDSARPDGGYMGISYYAMANVLPGRHVIAFVPAGWPGDEVVEQLEDLGPEPHALLTPRELQVLQLAADGLNGPLIAEQLVVSTSTVRSHFRNIYEKLEVPDRAAAVARAMRLGLIR
jgi:PAS domain S-box-containing protein